MSRRIRSSAVLLLLLGVHEGRTRQALAHAACGPRERVEVHDVAGLVANIGRPNVRLVLAAGRYVLPPCQPGVDENGPAACGQLEQGDCSVLTSSLELERDDNGVPLGGGPVVNNCDELPVDNSALIDCGQLPASDNILACIQGGNQSTISNLTVCQGARPTPLPAGASGVHRAAIMIRAGKQASVEGVRLVNVRRGVHFTAADNSPTSGVVRNSLVEGTELAGINLWARKTNSTASGTNGATIRAELKANRITRAGLHPLLLEWGAPGAANNDIFVDFTDNVVDATNKFGITVIAASGNSETQKSKVAFEVHGGRLEGLVGLFIRGQGQKLTNTNTENTVSGTVRNLTIRNGVPAVEVSFLANWGTQNNVALDIKDSRYESESGAVGEVRINLNASATLSLDGSPAQFADSNTNFTVPSASYFSE